MIAELGLAALWLAAGFAALQAATGVVPRLADLAAPAAWSHALLLAVALVALLAVFMRVDLSVEAVIASADIGLPPPLRIAASWSEPPGALLLLATVFGALGGGVAFFGGGNDVLARLGGIALAVDVAVLAVAPFARADPWPIAGNGLAAALRDPAQAAVMPLITAGAALALAGLATRSARWFWAAAIPLAAALAVGSWGRWHVAGDPGVPAVPAMACAAVLLAAFVASRRDANSKDLVIPAKAGTHLRNAWVMGSRFRGNDGTGFARRSPALIAFAGAVIIGVGAAGPVTRTTRALPLARLTPAAGPGWTAIVARLNVGGTALAPEWRTTRPRGETFARAAVTPGWRDATAVTLAAAPRPGATRIVATTAPLLPLVWAGGMIVVLGAAIGVARR